MAKCMDMEKANGMMPTLNLWESTLDSILKEKKMDTGSILMQKAQFSKPCGFKGKSTNLQLLICKEKSKSLLEN